MKLKESQIKKVNRIIKSCHDYGIDDNRKIAYILATIYHETWFTFEPIEEVGKGKGRKYGNKVRYNGVHYFGEHIYYGRGFTQNTWIDVYETLTRYAYKEGKDWDFVNNPELLLQYEPSIWATLIGMTKGLYTGVGLGKYFKKNSFDPINARKIINGLDKAELIKSHYEHFLKHLNESSS